MTDQEILGAAMAYTDKHSGGGGTTNYNALSNKPQIAGNTLSGNKSLADLGIASASDLAAKQNALTAGDYVVIENDKISVSKLKQGKLDLYSYEFVTTDTSHTPKVKVVKKVNGETISETIYDEFQAANWMTFDNIIRFRYDAGDSYKWKYQCLVTSNEHVKDTVISWFWNQTVDYTETFDVGSSAITDLVTKGDMTDALATKQDTLTFDNTPTQNSTNPVKSGGVYSALAGKQDTLTFDDTPTDGSNNPVKSNGIYDSEKDIYAVMGEMGAKNLNIFPYKNGGAGDVWSTNGIDFTVLADGSIDVNRASSSSNPAYFRCGIPTENFNPIYLEAGEKYILSGSVSGVGVNLRDSTNETVATSSSGEEELFNCSNSGNYYIIISVSKDASPVHALVKPMLRLASDTDDTYQPYAKTNKQLTDDVALKQDAYETITYAQWQALTPEQQAAKDYYISDYPSSVLTAGNIAYDNTTSGMAANEVQGAIDELKSELNVSQTGQSLSDLASYLSTLTTNQKCRSVLRVDYGTSNKVMPIIMYNPAEYQVTYGAGSANYIYDMYQYYNGAFKMHRKKNDMTIETTDLSANVTGWILYTFA